MTDSPRPFDPTDHFMKLKGKDYLPVAWRLVWLRQEHRDAIIRTEIVAHDPEATFAMFKATVILPTGGEATGYGSETAKDFGDYIEKAETKAIGRALGALGFGTQFGGDFDFEQGTTPRIVDTPVQRHPAAKAPPQGGHLLDEALRLGGVQAPAPPRPDATFARMNGTTPVFLLGGIECIAHPSGKGVVSNERCRAHPAQTYALTLTGDARWYHKQPDVDGGRCYRDAPVAAGVRNDDAGIFPED